MQQLLQVLFLPKQTSLARLGKLSGFPPWLLSNTGSNNTLDAQAYARLLSQVCDPSHLSVTSSSSRGSEQQDLTPAVLIAKKSAGQHMAYILIHYIQCQLEFTLLPDIKQALMPGLYAVLTISSKEVLRMVNAAIDPQGLVLWKALYDDYRRFGRRDER
jgi:nucleolar pre-ribosomal-associated protein 2